MRRHLKQKQKTGGEHTRNIRICRAETKEGHSNAESSRAFLHTGSRGSCPPRSHPTRRERSKEKCKKHAPRNTKNDGNERSGLPSRTKARVHFIYPASYVSHCVSLQCTTGALPAAPRCAQEEPACGKESKHHADAEPREQQQQEYHRLRTFSTTNLHFTWLSAVNYRANVASDNQRSPHSPTTGTAVQRSTSHATTQLWRNTTKPLGTQGSRAALRTKKKKWHRKDTAAKVGGGRSEFP
ncbi:hypothetical protein ABL78_8438 [Leptomonas seymouri]|uniref:Uncharacterized protein n=1 Tax=Leptomonas seymouri TaxID=5684 RepID=A0A0N1HR19_LEPSE|nr:hypothetical protein ABL78_8438 [Leptomonas seymouri]|eukprot:KPI82552.1 hypothetical protein ABL78_8438 [Leptomonas seymouri]